MKIIEKVLFVVACTVSLLLVFTNSQRAIADNPNGLEYSSENGMENEGPTSDEGEAGSMQHSAGTDQVDSIVYYSRGWDISPDVKEEAVRNWVNKELEPYFQLNGQQLGGSIGDKVHKEITIPERMYLKAYEGEDRWNGQWYINLGSHWNWVKDGFIDVSNFTFSILKSNGSEAKDIKISISGEPASKKRLLTIERTALNMTTDTTYIANISYNFAAKGWMCNDYGALSGRYNTIEVTGAGTPIRVPVTTVQMGVSAEANPQTVELGYDFLNSQIGSYNHFVKNVKIGNTFIDSSSYTTQPISSARVDIIGDFETIMKVSYPGVLSQDVVVPTKVVWGNSIIFGSADTKNSGRVGAAFHLDKSETPSIYAASGAGADSEALDQSYTNNKYFSIDLFNRAYNINMTDTLQGEHHLEVKGSDAKVPSLVKWGTNRKVAVNYGDIVRAWHVDPSKNELYENEQLKKYNKGMQAVYYEITKEGFKPLGFNQLEPKVISIPINSENSYIDNRIEDILMTNTDDVRVVGFTKYPDTSISGQKHAEIAVQERLSNGNYINYSYSVLIIVDPGALDLKVPVKLEFDEVTLTGSKQIITRKDMSPEVIVKDNRGGKKGNWTVTAKLKQTGKGISPYLIYRESGQADIYLKNGAVPIYNCGSVNTTSPLNVTITEKWREYSGILLEIPGKVPLKPQNYEETIIWNLTEGPEGS